MKRSLRNTIIIVGVVVILITAAIPVSMTFGLFSPQVKQQVDGVNYVTEKYKPTKPAKTTQEEEETTTQKRKPDNNNRPGGNENNDDDDDDYDYTPHDYTTKRPTTKVPQSVAPTKAPTTTRNNAVVTEKTAGELEDNVPQGSGIDQKVLDDFGLKEVAYIEEEEGNSLLSYKMDPHEGYFYTEEKAWQRQFGFNRIYDQAATLIFFYYDTLRAYMNHDGLDWMIQLWKGQYGFMFLGAEIGVYTKPEDRSNGEIDHYDCATDEQMLGMEIRMYNKGEVGFRRPYKKYWWATGFIAGTLEDFRDKSQLVLEARLTLHDEEMAELFADELLRLGFTQAKKLNLKSSTEMVTGTDEFYQRGKDVFFVWQYLKENL